MEELVVESGEEGRLDKFLALRFPDYSRTYFQELIDKHLVLLNGALAKKRALLEVGDEVEVEFILAQIATLEPENIALDILYEDEWLLAINKGAGLVVHPGAGHPAHTFVNALLYHCKHLPKSDHLRPGIVHRLDKDTTGVLLAAKEEVMQRKLVELFAERKMQKEYLAICVGIPPNQLVETKIGRHPTHRKEMAVVSEGGKSAITSIQRLSTDGTLSLVRLFPHTGRTHQLRVHLKWLGTPILGDPVYGSQAANKKYSLSRQLLHAEKLRFTHPMTGQTLEIIAKVPEDMQRFIRE